MAVETRLNLGEWWSADDFAYAITGVETSTTFYDTFEKQKRMQMPEDKKLVFADLKLKNISPEKEYLPYTLPFGVVSGKTAYQTTGGFDHPAYDSKYGVDMDWFRRASEKYRLQPSSTQQMPSGEVAKAWIGFVVPRDFEVMSIGYDTSEKGKYEIRWMVR